MFTILSWIVVSLVCATLVMYIAERWGVEYSIGLFTALVVMAQVFANKLVVFGDFVVPGGVIVFSISFLITDALNEFYDKDTAMKAVYSGLFGCLLLVLGVFIVLRWDYPVFWEGQEAFESVLGMTWRIVLASLCAYLFSQSWDVYFFDKIREWTGNSHLWLRNCASTLTSQLIDSVIFVAVAFYGYMSTDEILAIIAGQYVVKLIIALFDTPFLYWLRFARRRW